MPQDLLSQTGDLFAAHQAFEPADSVGRFDIRNFVLLCHVCSIVRVTGALCYSGIQVIRSRIGFLVVER